MNTKLKVDKYREGGTIRLGIHRGKRSFAAFLTQMEAQCLAAELSKQAATLAGYTGWEMLVRDDFDKS